MLHSVSKTCSFHFQYHCTSPYSSFYCLNIETYNKYGFSSIQTAMRIQHIDTYGLNLSPILAHFQKIPNTLDIIVILSINFYPSLLRSMIAGISACRYVHVHMTRRMTRRRLSKLNKADIFVLLEKMVLFAVECEKLS